MAYCLRLPRDTVQLIEEMRCHWKDLAELKAAGGTPAARLIKTIIVENGSAGVSCWVRPQHEEEVYFRVYAPRVVGIWGHNRRLNRHTVMLENSLDFNSSIKSW